MELLESEGYLAAQVRPNLIVFSSDGKLVLLDLRMPGMDGLEVWPR